MNSGFPPRLLLRRQLPGCLFLLPPVVILHVCQLLLPAEAAAAKMCAASSGGVCAARGRADGVRSAGLVE